MRRMSLGYFAAQKFPVAMENLDWLFLFSPMLLLRRIFSVLFFSFFFFFFEVWFPHSKVTEVSSERSNKRACITRNSIQVSKSLQRLRVDRPREAELRRVLQFRICIGNYMIWSDIWHKYHEWYFEIVIHNFTSREASEMWDNFEISRVFMPNITYKSCYYLFILLLAKSY